MSSKAFSILQGKHEVPFDELPKSFVQGKENDAGDSPHFPHASRCNPYGARPQSRRGFRQGDSRAAMDKEGQNTGALQRLGLPVRNRGDGGHQGGYRGGGGGATSDSGWFKVQIPHGKKYGKDAVLKAINSMCDVPFMPYHYHHKGGNMAEFFVQDNKAADAIRRASRRYTFPNGFKMVILVRPCGAPSLPMDDNTIEKLKISMSNHYDPATRSLDLSNFYADEALNKEGIHLALNKVNVMVNVLKIIGENIPEVVSVSFSNNRLYTCDNLVELSEKGPNIKKLDLSHNQLKGEQELDKIKKLKLEELVLEGNPFVMHQKDQSAYVSAVRKRFPKVLKLDGKDLPPPIGFDLESPTDLPTKQGSYFMNEEVKNLVVRFLEQYFSIYDSDDRQGLLEAYHNEATFSVNIAQNLTLVTNYPKYHDYLSESRNLVKVKDPVKRNKCLKQGKLNVVAALCNLPKTSHDANSFVLDVTNATQHLLSFIVSGIFKESDTKSDKPPVRYFSRHFVTVPQGSGIVIINEMLTITNATPKQVQSSFKQVTPTPSPSPVPGSSPVVSSPLAPDVQRAMVKSFSQQSGMNEEWSQKCLDQNDWDFQKSAKVFTELQQKGAIPAEAYLKPQ
ncbi:nuclear RNA export factor 1 [Lingula anatina]|uniref:Nuclear RNA export factor 1 n=1 Tax=Lingula anatina TaxID=7574 RepID=A0A1S3JK04_LINAN|nr:nuclear RNA export factor 1 [Lingula anatina]|eukprot:XP_013410745.1 nuclear RNA export factor 1 [Lingula anatina]